MSGGLVLRQQAGPQVLPRTKDGAVFVPESFFHRDWLLNKTQADFSLPTSLPKLSLCIRKSGAKDGGDKTEDKDRSTEFVAVGWDYVCVS